MLEKLFANPGEKIKKYAKVLFIIECVVALIAGIIASDEMEYIELLLVTFAGGVVVAYISSLFMAAFGDLVQSSIDNKKVNEEILNELKNK